MAAGLLLTIVVAVTGAVSAGQQNARAAHERIAGTLAAEELMSHLTTEPWANLAGWDGYREEAGAMADETGAAFPDAFHMIGREVEINTALQSIGALKINVRGRSVTVRAFNLDGVTLVELTRFIPEPQS